LEGCSTSATVRLHSAAETGFVLHHIVMQFLTFFPYYTMQKFFIQWSRVG